MELQTMIITIVTMIVTYILGVISKKAPWLSNNLIPVQNLLIGIIVAIVYWIITEDFSVAIAVSGLLAGGIYDIGNNLKKIAQNNNIPIPEDKNKEG